MVFPFARDFLEPIRAVGIGTDNLDDVDILTSNKDPLPSQLPLFPFSLVISPIDKMFSSTRSAAALALRGTF